MYTGWKGIETKPHYLLFREARMTADESLQEIKSRITSSMSLVEALTEFIKFFNSTTIASCPKHKEQDMLLFQYGGPYSWSDYFSVNLTRQCTFTGWFGVHKGMTQLSSDDARFLTIKELKKQFRK